MDYIQCPYCKAKGIAESSIDCPYCKVKLRAETIHERLFVVAIYFVIILLLLVLVAGVMHCVLYPSNSYDDYESPRDALGI